MEDSLFFLRDKVSLFLQESNQPNIDPYIKLYWSNTATILNYLPNLANL